MKSRALVADLALIGPFCVLLWLGIGMLLEQQQREAVHEAVQDTTNLAQASEENTLRMIDAIDRTLLFLRSAYTASGGVIDLTRWMREIQKEAPDALTLHLGVLDAGGQARARSEGPIETSLDFSDREYFRAQQLSSDDQLFISKPVLGRESGRWLVQFTRKIVGADGAFAGVVVVSADPIRLARFYASLDVGHGSVLLAGLDGIVRAESTDGVPELGRDISMSPLLTAARKDAKGTLELEGLGPGPQIASFRRLDRYGLVLAVGLTRDDILAGYLRARSHYLWGGTLLTGLILVIGATVVRHRQALIESRQVLTDTLEHMGQGILMVDSERRVAAINRRAVELLGLPAEQVGAGMRYDDILRWQLDSGEFADNEALRKLAENGGLERTDATFERTRPNGTVLEVRSCLLSDGRGAVRTFTDVTERRRAEAHISHLAHHDGLTGLANRRSFQEQLDQAVRRRQRGGTPFAVLSLDLDRFKHVNDSRGHDVGDLLLQAVADRLRANVREEDVVTRFGGDEFSVLQMAVGQPESAAALAERLVVQLSEPYELRGMQVVIGASVGIALFPTDGPTGEALLKSADIALYGAKEAGRGTFRFFEPEMDRRLQERLALERDFAEALAAGEIEVHFQPICDIVSRRPVAFEALARWAHRERGVVSPSVFIPLAEEIGLVPALGRHVLRTACQAATRWPARIRVAVNLSPLELLEPDLTGQVRAFLGETGLDPRRLDLEVTEGLLIRNGEAALAAMRELRGWGTRVYLDDFGTGHAGLTYLLRSPLDGIKVDRSFVANLDVDRSSQAVMRAALLLSEQLGLDVVAEGVETEAQLEFLRAAGCHQAQGFLLGRPQSDAELGETFSRHRVDRAQTGYTAA